jgi:formylglycine-generating enzyme required for sulfatase activity
MIVNKAMTRVWLAATTALAVVATAHGAVPLAENGQAKAVLVHNGHTKPDAGLPAEYVRNGVIKSPGETLKDYLKQITGAELPLVATAAEAEGKPAIVLELADRVPGASGRATGKQAYRIRSGGNRVTLIAATPLGLHNAVYGLLEDHLGCRFYTFKAKGLSYGGPGLEVVPRCHTLALPDLDDLQEPAFANRGFIYWLGSYPWILRNRGVGSPADRASGALAAGHNMYALLPPQDSKHGKEVIKGLFAEHPDFYPMNRAGQRVPDWAMGICGTRPDLPKFLAQGLERAIKSHLEASRGQIDWSLPFSAAQGDGFTGCQCPDCRRLVHAEQSEAAPLILALNRTLEIVNKTYPEARVITFAYFETLDSPKTLRPHPHLWINVVSSARSQNSAGDQVGPIVGNPANRDYARALREWPKIAPNRVTVWHWDTYRSEWPSVFYVAGNLRYLRDCGIYGVNPQVCGGPWNELLVWLYLKLAWNPEADADKLTRQFLDDNYGQAAAAHVWEYLKLTRAAYADSCHIPSAVRWAGWTEITRQKMFQPYLERMTAAMDQATAAAEKAGEKTKLANLLAARGSSLDLVLLNDVTWSGRPWGPVKNPADGKNWFVAGADPRVPACLLRAKQGKQFSGGGEHGVLREISWYVAGNGGPLVQLDGKAMTAAVCPDLKGQIVSAADRNSGRELLSVQGGNSGYADEFSRISSQIWLPPTVAETTLSRAGDMDWTAVWSEFKNPAPDRLETDLTLSPPYYGFDISRHLRRTVSVTDAGLQVKRTYRGALDHPNRFSTRWLLALPKAKLARVAVRGGGIDQMLDLRYAVPGGIKGVKAGERLPGADWMDERIDAVIAVPDAEPVKLPLKADAGGEVTVSLDRGDGIAAVLKTSVTGWEAVELKPVVERNYLQVTLVGAVQTAPGNKAEALALPTQTLGVRAMPVAKPMAITAPAKTGETVVEPKIKITGPNTAVNQRDGAGLLWIPAGEFLRGSPEGKGGGDERPQKKITLDGFWIYKTPVTLAQYTRFCEATGKKFEPTWGQGMHADPKGDDGAYAVQASWYEAESYAKAMGAALPTEAQWEKAARGTDGRAYPWGNDWDPKKCVSMEETVYKFAPGFRPVGSYPAGVSPYGALDMAGNVWEWGADWYQYEHYASAPEKNPTGPEKGTHKVLRGGCSLYDERLSRCAARMIMAPHVRDWTCTGFRCVVNAPGPERRSR